MNELALYQYTAAALTVAPVPRSGNYTICAPNGAPATLRRGVDFGMIRKKNGDAMTKNPTLFKSGAEKVAVAYGLCQRYTLESKLEDIEHGFFYFLVRCDLIKIYDGKEFVITPPTAPATPGRAAPVPSPPMTVPTAPLRWPRSALWSPPPCPLAVCPICSPRTSRATPRTAAPT